MSTICKSSGAILFLLCLAGIACGDENSVSVAGRGEIKAPPDVAYVTVYVKAEGAAMVDAAKEADQKVEEVKTALKKRKEVRSIEICDVTIGEAAAQAYSPYQQKEEPPHPEIVRQVRLATAPEPAKVYELIDAALAAGAVMQVPSSIRYSGDTRSVVVYGLLRAEPMKAKAREEAMAAARNEARSLAALAGKHVGSVIKIGDQETYRPISTVRIMGREPDLPTRYFSLNAKEVTVDSALSVMFELK